MKKEIFNLFSNCKLVKGARRSVICDLQRGDIHLITNGLCEILTVHSECSIEEIKTQYPLVNPEVIDGYFKYLIENDLGVLTDSKAKFPSIDMRWDFPGIISNAIIEVSKNSSYDIGRLLLELEDLGCKSVEMRFYDPIPFLKFEIVLDDVKATSIRSADFYLQYADEYSEQILCSTMLKNQRVNKIVVHSAPYKKTIDTKLGKVFFITERLRDNSGCGKVHVGNFSCNLSMFTESKIYNSCLNRKISVSMEGDVKNCPSTSVVFGSLGEDKLVSIVQKNTNNFDFWKINKDQIEVCKDCEFRYVCTDCRAYISEPTNFYSKPLKCNYNPYTAEWEEPSSFEAPTSGPYKTPSPAP